MGKKHRPSAVLDPNQRALDFTRRVIAVWLPVLYLLIDDAFYLRTYDSAQVKITLVQMGGVTLLTLWLCQLAMEGGRVFRKEAIVTLSPFLAYFGHTLLSMALFVPYRYPSVDDFIRYIFYMTVALIVIRDFEDEDMARLTKVLIWATWICSGYGIVQLLDTQFFPGGRGVGIDPFVWRGAFGKRVFSTFGNPNFFGNYLVLIFPIVAAQALKRRAWSLVPLLISILFNLYFTETKGAWIGFTVMISLFLVTYAIFFSQADIRAALKKAGMVIVILVVVIGGATAYWVKRRFNSVSFRVMTWLSTFEMIEALPWTGNGVGTFKVIYPAYRRPAIFHIEGKHNTETDHSENEWLEQWFDRGLLGGVIFLWLVFSTVLTGLRALKVNTEQTRGPPSARAYDILGYLMAFLGMLSHNFFDVSMRFVSSGIFLGLLPGVIINLSRGMPLRRYSAKEEEFARSHEVLQEAGWHRWLRWALSAGAAGGLVWQMKVFVTEFAELQGPLGRVGQGGELLQWWIAWVVLLAIGAGITGAMLRVLHLNRRVIVPLIVAASLWPMQVTWGFFKADVHHNIAIFWSKQGKWDNALENYLKVIHYNPAFIMAYYFMGNVYNDRLDEAHLKPNYHPEWGDKDGVERNDYERAMDSYAQLRAMAPNYVQMHHQVGVLYLKMAEFKRKFAGETPDPKRAAELMRESDEFIAKAEKRFWLYQEIDPVFNLNYFRRAQIYLAKSDYDTAIAIYEEFLRAEQCFVHIHDFDERYHTEGWVNLGNARLLKAQSVLQAAAKVDAAKQAVAAASARDLAVRAATAYKIALKLNATHEKAKTNLNLAVQRANQLGAGIANFESIPDGPLP